jgi:oligoendopeptidase F
MRFAMLAAALATAAAVHAQPAIERPEDRWNLEALYPTVAAFNEDLARMEAQLPQIAACKGTLGDSAARLKSCMDLQYDALRRFLRLLTYASEKANEDTGNADALALLQRTRVAQSGFTEAVSFVNPEILALGRDRVETFLRQEPGLAPYRFSLDNVLRTAPHTLDTAGEAILASFDLSRGQARQVYGIFSNADMPWPTVKLADGTEVRIDQAGYGKHRESANRDDRKKVMDAFFGKFKAFETTLGVTFYGALREDTVYTKVRKYPDSLARELDDDKIPVAVYDALIRATNENLPTLHRYFRLRARILGVPEMRYYDIYPPLVGGGRTYPIDEGIRIMLESVAPLGPEYVAAMRQGLKDRWMDTYPRPKKLSGAHVFGVAYDVHPFVLMNYQGNYESVSTLAHEWGHAIHSHLSNRGQPFATARYATFVAEIASTTNEGLLLDYMLKSAKNDEERLLYLGSALETLRGTYFRQTMFAEFERRVHDTVDKGQPLTGAQLTQIYGEILRRYHGDAVKVDDLYAIEWAYIPHFYTPFYVFQYATSIAAGSLFADDLLANKPGVRERYLKLLSAGGSDYPYELVKAAGVDLATPAPYNAIAARMNRIMDEIEVILAKRK